MRRWRVWLGVAVSAVAIVFAARGVEWEAVGRALADADYGTLGLVVVLTPAINIGMRALRWRLLLLPVRRVRLADCVVATAIGLMANNVLPARIGEFVRAYALGKRKGVETGTAFGALFVERLLDGFALVGLLLLVTWTVDLPDWVDTTTRVAFGIFTGFLLFQLVLAYRPAVLSHLGLWISRRLFGGRFDEAVERIVVTFVDGFRLLRSPLLVALGLLLAFVQWGSISALYYLGLSAFGLTGSLPGGDGLGWGAAIFTNCVTSLGVAVPSSPGFVGTFQAFVVESLEVFGVDSSRAFSFAVGFHAASYIGVTVAGLVFFFREGLSWREMEASEEKVEHDLEAEYEA